MLRGWRLPGGQAELVFFESFVEQLDDRPDVEQVAILAAVVSLCDDPGGKHPLHAPVAGWNTLEVLQRNKRVVYRVAEVDGVGLIEVLCLGPRSNNEIYDMAKALVASGLLDEDETTALWDALAIFDVVAETVGLDGWDFKPRPAQAGMVKAAVAANLLPEDIASALSQDELAAAMEGGFGPHGPDPQAALAAALHRARSRATPLDLVEVHQVISARSERRCGAVMPRAQAACLRREGHPGPHRAA